MKPHIIVSLIVITLLSLGCSNKTKVGNTFEKSFELVFDSLAMKNNSWLEFEIKKSQGIEISFSKGKYSNEKFRITANNYMSDDNPIKVVISTKTSGNYDFEMNLVDSSEDVDVNYSNKSSISLTDIKFVSTWEYYLWLLILGGALLLGSLAFLIWRDYNNKNPKFEEGYIDISFPSREQIDLSGKRAVDIAKSIGSDKFTCILRCQVYEEYIEDDYIEVSFPVIEISDNTISLIINDKQIDTTIGERLNEKDSVVINSSLGDKLVEFKYIK